MRELLQSAVAIQIQTAVSYMTAIGIVGIGKIKRRHRRTHTRVLFVAHGHLEDMRIRLVESVQHNLADILLAHFMTQAVRCCFKGLHRRTAGNFTRCIAAHTIRNSKKIWLTHQQRVLIIFSN